MDRVVTNGKGIARQKVEVYCNAGLGNYPDNPQWSSKEMDDNSHLSVGASSTPNCTEDFRDVIAAQPPAYLSTYTLFAACLNGTQIVSFDSFRFSVQ